MVPRLCNNRFYAGVLLLSCFGCSGQNIEGRWIGKLPFETPSDCQIRLANSSGFDAVCGKDDVVGDGRYRWNGKTLTLQFRRFARSGVLRSVPKDLVFDVKGEGNTLQLQREGASFEWKREMH